MRNYDFSNVLFSFGKIIQSATDNGNMFFKVFSPPCSHRAMAGLPWESYNLPMLSRGSKIFFIVVFIAVALSVAYTFYDTMILKRFDVFFLEEEIPTYRGIFSGLLDQAQTYVQ